MDTEPEELRFLSFFGIFRESFKVLRSHAKLFLYLTLALIVPLCLVTLGHTLITDPIASRIVWDKFKAEQQEGTSAEQKTKEDIQRELTKLYVVLAIYLLFLLAFSLLSTSAIVYSVACIFSEKVTTVRKVLTVVPRVWKRLLMTFFWAIVVVFVYLVVCMIVLFIVDVVTGLVFGSGRLVMGILYWGGLLFLFGNIIYINCVWHLGSVITVLEESYGLQALRKSLSLIRGKQLVGFCLFLVYFVCTFLISMAFGISVVHGNYDGVPIGARIVLGCGLILLLSLVDLVGFIIQTVFYFTCKACHHESIDRLQLSEHLGAYLGEYQPLHSAIQMEALEP